MSSATSRSSAGDMQAQETNNALLAFTLGPVQPFIAAAQSVRDLWSGSYILSWLVAHSLAPVLKCFGPSAIVLPSVQRPGIGGAPPVENALVAHAMGRPVQHTGELLTPSLPNRFVAFVPDADAQELAVECKTACREAWLEICEAVRRELDSKFQPLDPNWAREWKSQVESCFEICTAVLPFADCTPGTLAALLGPDRAGRDEWQQRFELAGRLLEAQRMIRYVPAYRPTGDALHQVPAKCSLLGTYEQVGPADLEKSRLFWEKAQQVTLRGTNLRRHERLCAISLVKRFAWPAFFSRCLKLEPEQRKYSDTATVAAHLWLAKDPPLDIERIRKEAGSWSGQWLHWSQRDEGRKTGESEVPKSAWEEIQGRLREHGRPPGYFAVLMLDGDRMGARLECATRAELSGISTALARFASSVVPQIISEQKGELVYSGGDDVLALLPTATALTAARGLANEFANLAELQTGGATPSVSAGVAVVHFKEDLRFALEQARAAESKAKQEGRKAIELRICRRSGEHSSVRLSWTIVPNFEKLLRLFIDEKLSDRWAYKLRQDAPVLGALPRGAIRTELRRIARRVEEHARELEDWLLPAFEEYCYTRTQDANSVSTGTLVHFCTLCQSASFLARGRDDR